MFVVLHILPHDQYKATIYHQSSSIYIKLNRKIVPGKEVMAIDGIILAK